MNDKKTKKSARLFKSQILEKFTRVNPFVAIVFNLTCMSSLFYLNFKLGFVTRPGLVIGIFLLGFVSWTLSEYLLHRFLFHFKEEHNAFLGKVAQTIHGIHHDFPNDYHRLFMPPLPATLFILVFFGLFYLVMGNVTFVFLPGFLLGYLCYAYTHFKIHQVKAPKRLKWLWTHHLKHHYQDANKAYGVSTPIWDFVFRSLPRKSAVKSPEGHEDLNEAAVDEEQSS